MRKQRIIWQSDINIKDFEDYLQEEHPEVTDEYEKHSLCQDLNDLYLDDERANLDIQLNNSILCIADLGLWNGRQSGYRVIESGNISDILSENADRVKWYTDGYNIRCKAIHHDGVNYYEYREIRSDRDINNLLDRIYNGEEFSRQTLNYYTRSILPHVAEVYGW